MSDRRDRVRERLPGIGIDALLVTTPVNVRYVTGFTGSNAQLLVGTEDVFLTDPRYQEQSARQVGGCRFSIYYGGGSAKAIAEAVASIRAKRVGFEPEQVTVATHRRLSEALGPGVELVETVAVVEDLRIRKDEEEIEALRRACAIGDAGFSSLLGALREGMSERDVAIVLEDAMRGAGSEAPSFDTIVAFGESAAEPHHAPSERRLRRGDMIKLDFGATWGGYHSDMTRTIAFGDPSDEMVRVYELVRTAQQTGVEAVRAGVTAGEVDAAAREPLRAAGFDFGHGTGHGVGLLVHEAPAVRKDAVDILAPGMTVTVEPGIYLPGVGGVRIEDTVVVRDGECEILTRSPKELIRV